MKTLIAAIVTLGLLMSTTSAQNKIFPYKYFTDDLPSGLRVITVPTDYPNLVALYIAVNTGSRNEVEPGKSGFAHLFEHLMFRGTDKFSADAYNEALKNAGLVEAGVPAELGGGGADIAELAAMLRVLGSMILSRMSCASP